MRNPPTKDKTKQHNKKTWNYYENYEQALLARPSR